MQDSLRGDLQTRHRRARAKESHHAYFLSLRTICEVERWLTMRHFGKRTVSLPWWYAVFPSYGGIEWIDERRAGGSSGEVQRRVFAFGGRIECVGVGDVEGSSADDESGGRSLAPATLKSVRYCCTAELAWQFLMARNIASGIKRGWMGRGAGTKRDGPCAGWRSYSYRTGAGRAQ